ncbi:MAG: hypothetical protein AAFQ63_02745 [Cyanobacteria bacterium J06621_11]
MKLENFRIEQTAQLTKAVATVIWETSDRQNADIYFGTPKEFTQDINCDPHAFLVACVMPAMRFGEERIYIDAEICPELKEGLETVVTWMKNWYGGNRQPVRIEAKPLEKRPNPETPERAGFFFSGGVDSLSTLRNNRLRFPKTHPGYIKDGFMIYGIEGYESSEAEEQLEAFNLHLQAIDNVARAADIELIPVYTNIKSLEEDWEFWRNEFQGAALAAVGHVFAKRVTKVSIGSTFDIASLEPWGSHPVIDLNFSSSYLHIHHDGVAMSRLDKVKLISNWQVALDNVKVCFTNSPKQLNCGVCEKCIRTRTALLALGKLDKASAFKQEDIDEGLLSRRAHIDDAYVESCYVELIDPLIAQGREDLVKGIKTAVDRYHERDIRGLIKKVDKRLLGGHLLAWKQKRSARHSS